MNQVVTLKLGVEKGYIEVDFPEITIASTGQKTNVIEASRFKGGMTLTVRPHKTENAEFEIVPQKQIDNEK